MKALYVVLFTLGCFITDAQAALYLDIDMSNILRCTLSSRHHNRIVVDGKRIKKVIYPEGAIAIRVEEQSGQIFVQPMIEAPPNTTVSIVTNDGLVQDLELNFEDKTSEIVILQTCSTENFSCESEEFPFRNENFPLDSIQALINSILNGSVPEEYTVVEAEEIDCMVNRGVSLKSLSKLIGSNHTIYIIGIENQSSRRKILKEQEINILQGDWIFIENRELHSKEKTIALIGVSNL